MIRAGNRAEALDRFKRAYSKRECLSITAKREKRERKVRE